jgi:hypothetical protein
MTASPLLVCNHQPESLTKYVEILKWKVADQLRTGKAYKGNCLGLYELQSKYFLGELYKHDWNPLSGKTVTQPRFEMYTKRHIVTAGQTSRLLH